MLSKGFTLNLRTGEIYTFGSLFNPGVNYQTNISQQLLAQDNWIGIDAELISDIQDDDEFYITSNCPGLPASSVCLGIPTNFTSGAARGRVLFIDIKEVGDILSSEEAIQALLD